MKQNKIAYLDCFAGVSGDMVLGALLDLGLPAEVLTEGWQMLGLKGVEIKHQRVQRGGLTGVHVEVTEQGKSALKDYGEMRQVINGSALPAGVKEQGLKILQALAQAEAAIHGVAIDKVHFHEIGGIDTIVDVVGAALGIAYFNWKKIICSPLPLGRGFVDAGHGRLPLPAPATMALLKGVPITPAAAEGETVTPTGAAIVTTLASAFGPVPAMEVTGIGYGAGTRDPHDVPNLLRIIHGIRTEEKAEDVWVLEADVDDMIPELLPYLTQLLLKEGAVDASVIPIQMKKGRPGFTIRCLATAALREKLAQLILRESTTLGVRQYPVERVILAREEREVETAYGTIKIKVAFDSKGKVINLMPEYESCRQAAEAKQVPLKEVYQEAIGKGREAVKHEA
ncbi:MAG: TIGR00299 family protein [Deltaproteobacteria bacterium RBG_16_54_18]|nr:MAG: TIGR00299 family protein [Deltaproteobacteria bacterium RBG_16_54_18]